MALYKCPCRGAALGVYDRDEQRSNARSKFDSWCRIRSKPCTQDSTIEISSTNCEIWLAAAVAHVLCRAVARICHLLFDLMYCPTFESSELYVARVQVDIGCLKSSLIVFASQSVSIVLSAKVRPMPGFQHSALNG